MKIEFELPDEYKNEKMVIYLNNDPTPIVYINVYEEGDTWVKKNNCSNCPEESRKKCCGGCPMFSSIGCYFHIDSGSHSNKPFDCVIKPTPDQTLAWCQLEFECVKGTRKGYIKKINQGTLIDNI